MLDYFLIFLAVACFAFQFIFTKAYSDKVEQNLETALTMLFLTGVFGATLYFAVNGFALRVSTPSVLLAGVFAVVMNPTDGKFYPSETPPSHTDGVQAYDGINWVCTQEGALYDCGCRNIVLKDIRLQKKRTIAVAIDLNNDTYARSFTEGSKPVPQGNITFDNVCVEADIQTFFRANYPVENITIKNSDIKDAKILFEGFCMDGLSYPPVTLTVENTALSKTAVVSDGRHQVTVLQK